MQEITAETFETFRAQHPACALLVLSDTRAGTVLLAHGDLAYPQEYLDAVSALAQDTFDLAGPDAPYALLQTPACCRLVVRGGVGTDLAFTALCAPDAELKPILEGLVDLAASLAVWTQAA